MSKEQAESLFDSQKFASITECEVCGRQLSNRVSVAVGIGPVCRGWRSASHHHDNEGGIPLTNYSDGYIAEPMIPKILVERDEEGRVWTNVPHLVTHHSPDGYEFGYSGSGPADLALNICQVLVRDMGYGEHDRVKCWDGECSARFTKTT